MKKGVDLEEVMASPAVNRSLAEIFSAKVSGIKPRRGGDEGHGCDDITSNISKAELEELERQFLEGRRQLRDRNMDVSPTETRFSSLEKEIIDKELMMEI